MKVKERLQKANENLGGKPFWNGFLSAGSLAAVIGVAIASGSGHKATSYDVNTEVELMHAMRPAMVRIATQADNAARAQKYDSATSNLTPGAGVISNLNADETMTRIVLTDGAHRRLEVVSPTNPIFGYNLIPQAVEYVGYKAITGYDDGAPLVTEAYLTAPEVYNDDSNLSLANGHPDGWAAAQRIPYDADFVTRANTSSADYPVGAAERIVKDMEAASGHFFVQQSP